MSSYEDGYGAGYSDGLMSSTEIPSLFGTVLGEIGLIALLVKWFDAHFNNNTKDLEFSSPEGAEAWKRIKNTARIFSESVMKIVIIAVVFPIAFVYNLIRIIIGDCKSGSINTKQSKQL